MATADWYFEMTSDVLCFFCRLSFRIFWGFPARATEVVGLSGELARATYGFGELRFLFGSVLAITFFLSMIASLLIGVRESALSRFRSLFRSLSTVRGNFGGEGELAGVWEVCFSIFDVGLVLPS